MLRLSKKTVFLFIAYFSRAVAAAKVLIQPEVMCQVFLSESSNLQDLRPWHEICLVPFLEIWFFEGGMKEIIMLFDYDNLKCLSQSPAVL